MRVRFRGPHGVFNRPQLSTPPLDDLGYGVDAIGFATPSLVGEFQVWIATLSSYAWWTIATVGAILLGIEFGVSRQRVRPSD